MPGRKRDHLVDRLSTRIGETVERVSDTLAGHIDAELLDDTQEVSQGQFLEHFRSRWPDPAWRQQMLERMGANGFYEAAMQAWGGTKPEPLGRLVRDGQTRQAGRGQELPPDAAPAPPPMAPRPLPPPPAYQAMAHNGVARATGLEPPPPVEPPPNGPASRAAGPGY
jgi:hypothetical protein